MHDTWTGTFRPVSVFKHFGNFLGTFCTSSALCTLPCPVLDIRRDRQLLMPFISQQDGYIISSYMDYLSFFSFEKSK